MIVCASGMHRSGTSLISSYLLKCGVSMGDEMLEGKIGNKHGLFEDRSFLQLHKDILISNKTFPYTYLPNTALDLYEYIPKDALDVSDVDLQSAREVYSRYSEKYSTWGWKDPRSSLFLDMWNNVDANENIKYLLLYREPFKVVDSLCRRLIKYASPYKYVMPIVGCKSWLRYNKSLIKFASENPDKVMLVNINGFIRDYKKASKHLCEWLDVVNEDFLTVYHEKELGNDNLYGDRKIYKAYLDRTYSFYQKEMAAVYEQLESMASISSSGLMSRV